MNIINTIFHCTKDHPKYKDARVIADYLGCEIIHVIENSAALDDYDCVLAWYSYNLDMEHADYYLSILDKNNHYKTYLYIDYVHNHIAGKKIIQLGYNDSLPKAMGLAKLKESKINILDGTAGFTIDSLSLLKLNKNICITLLEQSKIIFCLIKDALNRLSKSEMPEHQELFHRIKLVNSNYSDYIKTHDLNDFNLIYLDPMFDKYDEQKNKVLKSKPKKSMQLLQHICFNPVKIRNLISDTLELTQTSCSKPIKLIFKRNKSQEKLFEKKINYSVETKQIRYDVYYINFLN